MTHKSTALTSMRSRHLFISCITKKKAHCVYLWLRVGVVGSLQQPLPLIYKTPINLHNSNPDLGQARFSLVPMHWIDPGLA